MAQARAPATTLAMGRLRHGRFRRGAGALLLLAGLSWSAAAGAEPGLHIELNKVEDAENACLASFVVHNRLGQTLDRFSLDLYVFDRDGVIDRQVLLDLAPLRDDKTTVARFRLLQGTCDDIGRVLVNNIPSCRSEASGDSLDCLAGLSVSSRSEVELVK